MRDAEEYALYIEQLLDEDCEPDVDDVDYDPDLARKARRENAA